MVRLGLLVMLAALSGCSVLGSGGCSRTAPVPLVEMPLPPAHGKTLSVDAMDVDQQAHLVFTADRTLAGVDVVDVSGRTPQFVTTVPVGAPNGLAVAPDLHLVAAALNGGVLAIISTDRSAATPFAVLRRITTGGKTADLVGYDAHEHRFFVADPDGGSLYDVDPTGARPPRAIALGAGMEQPAWDPNSGQVLVAGGSYDGLYEVDPMTDALLARRPLSSGCNPNGLAINPNAQIALLGCSARGYQQVLFWDLRHAKLMRADREVGAGDLASYDAVANRFFFAASHFSSGPEVAIFDGSSGAYQTAVVLPAAVNSAVFDEVNRVVYTTDARPGKGGLFRFTVPAC